MRERRRVRAIAAIATLLLAAGLGACSDDTGDDATTDASTPSSGSGTDGGPAGAAAPTEPPADAAGSLLAVVDAAGGELTATDGDAGDVDADGGTYELTLTDVDPDVAWFSDRPQRHVGTFTVDQLAEAFFTDQSPPNAALQAQPSGAGEPSLVIVEIFDPSWDESARTLTMQARVLGAEDVGEGTALHERATQADEEVPASFGSAVLFVDDSCDTSGGTVTLGSGTSCSTAQDVVAAFDPPVFCTNTPVTVDSYAWTCDYSGAEQVDFEAQWSGEGGPVVASFTLDPSS